MTLNQTLSASIAGIHEKIAPAYADCGRDPSDVHLVAVSKQQPDDRIRAALI
jgi:uncharacterized pyridoxal phosphate-containing UPF0001 family protein